jgi:hypothetical protein
MEHLMAGQLIPLPGTEVEMPADMTPQQGIAIWIDLMRTGYKLVLAGLRHEIGPNGDLNAAYRAWYAEQMREHDEVVARVVERINRPPLGTIEQLIGPEVFRIEP